MPDDFLIRPVVSTDFQEWLLLWEAYNRFYGRDAFPKEITQMTWSRFLDTNEPVHALVAEQNDELIGLAHYLFHRSTIQIEMTCYLQDLFTKDSARGRGIGLSLIETVYAQAKSSGSPRIYLQTQEGNVIARRLYDKIATLSSFVIYDKKIKD